jgi:1-acyl-sn-glycerol-3-phosphate acyltransferase
VKLLRAIQSLWIWAASATLILAWVPMMAAIRLFERDPLHRRTARWFRRLGRVLAAINPWRVEISGEGNLPSGGARVIVSNHQSLADIPVISHLRIDTKWLGKAELFRVPILGWMMRMAGDIPVERGDRRKGARAMLACAHYLRRGCSVVFFPEGTRSRDGSVLPFNDGPFQLAIREQVPVLPLVVHGSGAALPRNSWMFGPAARVHLSVLEEAGVAGWRIEQVAELRDLVRRRMIAELERIRRAGFED